ncbi:aspartyl-phosphate phosphatase Spo0E family protein [Paenibacillus eucommiae]|uniref:Aspartyl-phosphate phosphatase Spo0E family protein n=1 Tax=Paenibacillus eucommiae TaxID=1355755 RepID=A0ABS4IYN9_9BACL|nr:aspartyl-phosphate phosphatase Spo0E family protein [Paenibacillus eucommiae]MBP1992709.1 hypothetical protein [Paenibacillus eucommiae]
MSRQIKFDLEINCLKRKLESAAAQYKYNFRHPKVLEISEKLDHLIVKQMKNGKFS